MKRIAIIASGFAVLAAAYAQRSPETAMVSSVSGQFYVSARSAVSQRSLAFSVAPEMVTLEPTFAAVSCERIKQELLRELRMRDEWRGKIFVTLVPAQSASDPVGVAPEWFAGSWNCGIQLPDVVDRERFVEAVVRACLTEIANRNATSARPTEIPEWLAQGFAGELLGTSEAELILQPPAIGKDGFKVTRLKVDLTDDPRVTGPNVRKLNPLADAIAVMYTNAPLTFDQLSWPTDDQLMGDLRDSYRSCAQLFVNQLLHLKNGPECMSAMMAELPRYLNWQLAFLDAFHTSFEEPLDVEKWWALQLVDFTGRDLIHLWTPEETWKQLDDLFQLPIDVKIGPAPPMRTEITFQTVIRGWSRTRQLQMLRQKLKELDLLRMHVSPEFMPLVDSYRQVLGDYYKERSNTKNSPQYGPLLQKIEDETIGKLDTLDAKRAAMGPQPQMPVVSSLESTDGAIR